MNPEQSMFWTAVEHGPASVLRPSTNENKGLFYCTKDWHPGINMREMFEKIKQLTKQGKLGFYSAMSNDGQAICIHHSHADDEIQKMRIQEQLVMLGLDPGWKAWRVREEPYAVVNQPYIKPEPYITLEP